MYLMPRNWSQGNSAVVVDQIAFRDAVIGNKTLPGRVIFTSCRSIRILCPRSATLFLPHYFFCFLALAQRKESGLTQLSISGPLAESNLRDQFRSDPVHTPARQIITRERRSLGFEFAELSVKTSKGRCVLTGATLPANCSFPAS
jgi:hypothetical protein